MATTRSKTLTVCRASAGTGKTYTLASTYVALLFSGESYRSILAVTFTNKATQEMKDRILLFLDNIARNTGKAADDALRSVRSHMIRNTGKSDDELREMAKKLYSAILEDYDNMHISTIDTFLLQLLNGLGQLLDNASAGAKVELDLDRVISKAVDNLLKRALDGSDDTQKRLLRYVTYKLEDGEKWDIRQALKDIAGNMYNESVQLMDLNGEIVFDADKIERYRRALDYRETQCYKDLQKKYEEWKDWTPEVDSLSPLRKFVEEVGQYLDGTLKDQKNMFRGGTDGVIKILEGTDSKGSFDKYYGTKLDKGKAVRDGLKDLYNLCQDCRKAYLTQKATIGLLSDMALMADLRDEIRAVLAEENTVLLAQTAAKLQEAMKQGDADFVLEKVGIRYNHIMLDEFQDTSVLQWANFKPLLQEILANGGTVFIVGDIKQSIYRWRNGDWTIMKNLGQDTPYLGNFFADKSLDCNFRSQKQVVEFNRDVFRRLAEMGYMQDVDNSTYTPSHDGGYVQMQLVPFGDKDGPYPAIKDAQNHICAQMFDTIAERLAQGEQPSDMLLLVRSHDDAQDIVDFYRDNTTNVAALKGVAIVSCDSFELNTSTSVQFVVQSLRWLFKRDEVSKAYLEMVYPEFDLTCLEAINTHTPLCELLEEIIKLLPSEQPQDLAYINCLLDYAHDFVGTHDPSVEAFFDYWDTKLHNESIAAPDINAIRIMTIHTAKGLEAPNVFIPFCHWGLEKDSGYLWCQAKGICKGGVEPLKMIPVEMKAELSKGYYAQELADEHEAQHVDNINTLYVAFTRARNNLYVYGGYKSTDTNRISTLLYNLFDGQWLDQDGTYFLSWESVPTAKENGGRVGLEDRFSFGDATMQTAELHVGERPIAFTLSRESVDCLRYGVAEGDETFSRIDLGNVCHGIMEHMETREDEEMAITDAQMSGLIPDDETLQQIRQLIDGAWENEQLCDWFSGKWELLREVTFLTANREMRPDRVMIDKTSSKAIVLDYKFGQHHDPKYPLQVRDYMRIMAELGYQHVEGYLWFAQDKKLQQVTLK